jgi:hypothetical protein
LSARRGRPAAAAIVGAALAVAVCATSAAAGKAYTFGVGDTFGIGGSKIECGIAAGVGYGLDLRGKTYVVCGPSTSVGNYVALMASDGHVYILSIKTHKTVSSRVPASAARRSSQYGVEVGDRITVKNTPLVCDVLKISGLPTLLCDDYGPKGSIRPSSYAFGISDGEVTSLEWDATRHVHILKAWSERR